MFARKRGAWMNFNDAPTGSVRVARIQPGCISTCSEIRNDRQPVLTNGKIASVSDTVTISPQTVRVEAVRGRA